MSELLPVLISFFWSGSKFMVGIAFIYYYEFPFLKSMLLAVSGGMTGTVLFSYFGSAMTQLWRRWFPLKEKKERKETRTSRIVQKVSNKYGLAGIAFLTPIFLTPPIGAMMATIMYKNRPKIFAYMFVAIFLWALVFLGSYHWLGLNINDYLPFKQN